MKTVKNTARNRLMTPNRRKKESLMNRPPTQNAEYSTRANTKNAFAYTAQTACDKKGYILDVTVNPGNVHDSVAFDGLYARLTEHYPEIQNVVADAGYKTPWIMQRSN